MSRTDRLRHPLTAVSDAMIMFGPLGIRPYVALSPGSPVKPAGMRMEPPPSPPVASVTSPPATAAAEPPEDPPGVCSRIHGFRVAPLSLVDVRLMPPNSDAVVRPIGIAPATRSRATLVESWSAISSRSVSDASVAGHPATLSSSFTPIGTPPKGWVTSAFAAAFRAPSGSRNEKALTSDASIAASVASSSSTGERSPLRNASTSETVSPDQGASTMGAEPSGTSRAHHHAPLLDGRQAEHVVALARLAHRRRRLGGVHVAGVEDGVVTHGCEALREAVVELVGVAAGQVGPAAAVEEQRVAGHEPTVDEEALAPRRVSGRVHQRDLDVAGPHDVTTVVEHEIGVRRTGHALDAEGLLA